jgi:hypothetical protein
MIHSPIQEYIEMKLKSCFLSLVLAAAAISSARAQELVRYNLFGQPGTQVSNSPEYVDPCVNGLDLTRSAGLLNTTSGNNSMNSSNWTVGAYYSFGFTVNPGFSANLTNLQIGTRSSSSGPKFLVLYSSVDNFTTPIATITHPSVLAFVNSDIDLSSLSNVTGTVEFRLRVDEDKRASDEIPIAPTGTNRVTNFFAPVGDPPVNTDSGGFRINGTCAPAGGATTVVGSSVIHYGFTGVGSIFDSVKSLHKEGASTQALSFNNLINSSRGINGVSFSLQDNGAGVGNLTADDFVFQMSPQGAFDQNDNPASGWELAPAPISLSQSGNPPEEIVTQVDIRWANNAIQNRWLRITLLANANTGLAEPEVYYLGHLLGETSGPTDGIYTVAFSDITPIRSQVGSVVDAGSIADIDKNGTVAFADISIMRPNVGTQLPNISVP